MCQGIYLFPPELSKIITFAAAPLVTATKALCLSKKLEALGVVNGVDDEIAGEEAPEAEAAEEAEDSEEEEESKELTPEEKAAAAQTKREIIKALLDGMAKSHEFSQGWMVANGLAHWWNLHLDIAKLCHQDPTWMSKTLQDGGDARKSVRTKKGEVNL